MKKTIYVLIILFLLIVGLLLSITGIGAIIGVPMIIVAIWLAWRAYRIKKEERYKKMMKQATKEAMDEKMKEE